MLNNIPQALIFKNPSKDKLNTIHSFLFVSLIAPNIVKNLKFFYNSTFDIPKLAIKQSYVLLTWFYSLTFLQNKTKQNKIKIVTLPVKKSLYTVFKAPIAHKNWSKEQYKFQFFLIKVTFPSKFNYNYNVKKINYALLFILLSKKNFPSLETNLLFLKNYWFTFYAKDSFFFNYYKNLL